MVSRKKSFIRLRKLIDSAESNYDHGRPRIGEKKIIEAYDLLGSFNFKFMGWPEKEDAVGRTLGDKPQ